MSHTRRRHQINYRPHGMDADLRTYVKTEACPECGEYKYLEPATGTDDYVDDEEMCMTEHGPRWFPYKTWSCANCGAEFRLYLGPISIRTTKEPDCDID